MKTRLFLMLVCSVLILQQKTSAQERLQVTWEEVNGVTIPIPPDVHPRLYIQEKDIPELKARLENPQIKKTIAAMSPNT